MPRSAKSAAETILDYFRGAPLEAAQVVLDFSKAILRDRRSAGPAIRNVAAPAIVDPLAGHVSAVSHKAKAKPGPKPAAAKSHKAKAKPHSTHAAPVSNAADKPARRKPGPKPGSHRKPKSAAEPAAIGEQVLPLEPLDLRQPIPGETEYDDPDFIPPAPGELPDYTQVQG